MASVLGCQLAPKPECRYHPLSRFEQGAATICLAAVRTCLCLPCPTPFTCLDAATMLCCICTAQSNLLNAGGPGGPGVQAALQPGAAPHRPLCTGGPVHVLRGARGLRRALAWDYVCVWCFALLPLAAVRLYKLAPSPACNLAWQPNPVAPFPSPTDRHCTGRHRSCSFPPCLGGGGGGRRRCGRGSWRAGTCRHNAEARGVKGAVGGPGPYYAGPIAHTRCQDLLPSSGCSPIPMSSLRLSPHYDQASHPHMHASICLHGCMLCHPSSQVRQLFFCRQYACRCLHCCFPQGLGVLSHGTVLCYSGSFSHV